MSEPLEVNDAYIEAYAQMYDSLIDFFPAGDILRNLWREVRELRLPPIYAVSGADDELEFYS